MKKGIVLLLALALAAGVLAEPTYSTVSATSTSQTITFAGLRTSLLICNKGANEIHYRIFTDRDTAAAATTSHTELAAGTATAPVCKTYQHNPRSESGNGYLAVAIVCAAAETATATLESK